MMLSRCTDLREQRLLRQGRGWFHVAAMGHEALAAVGLLMREGDLVAGYYRDRPIALGRGVQLEELAHAFHANALSSSGGRQMPSHFSDRSLGLFSPSSAIASSLLPACGLAWGLQLDGGSGLVVATVGDAGTRQGDFFEAISLAIEWRLPLLVLVEDNGLGISTRTDQSNPLRLGVLNRSLWPSIDAWDGEAVADAVSTAMAAIRSGDGPRFLWCRVERLADHTSNDDQTIYRPAAELEGLRKRDPLPLFRARLERSGELGPGDYERIEAQWDERVRLAYDMAAERSGAPRRPLECGLERHQDFVPPLPHHSWPSTMRLADGVNRILALGLQTCPEAVLFGEDVEDPLGGVFRLTRGLSTAHPGRVRNAPLAESTIVGVAVGLAAQGKRPIFELQFIDYIVPGLQHIANHLASLSWRSQGEWTAPAVFYAPCGAYLPAGGLWHSQSFASLLAQFPGLQIAVPANAADAVGLFWTALHSRLPSVILLPKHLFWRSQPFPAQPEPVPFGSARICRAGEDITIVTWGNGVELVSEALDNLPAPVSAELIDLRSVAPLDTATLLVSLRRTRRLLVVQEEIGTCSVGQTILSELVAVLPPEHLLMAPRLLSRLPLPIGFHPDLEAAVLPSRQDVADAITALLVVPASAAIIPSKDGAAPALEPAETLIPVCVPVLGEGLRQATLRSLLCAPGSPVRRDQVIAELETDKALLAVEAPADGELVRWTAVEGETDDLHAALAYLRPDVTAAIAGAAPTGPMAKVPARPAELTSPGGLPWPSFAAIRRVIAAAARRQLPWTPLAARVSDSRPTLTAMVAWALAHALATSTLRQELSDELQRADASLKDAADGLESQAEDHDDLRQAAAMAAVTDPDLGVAVTSAGGQLNTAVLRQAFALPLGEFMAAYRQAVALARRGEHQSLARVAWIVSSLGPSGPDGAVAVVVPPAFGTLFVSLRADELSLWLSFDHRWITGERALQLLDGVAASLVELRQSLEGAPP
jgi:2-oxoisovalerate dehydrogenase E1 component